MLEKNPLLWLVNIIYSRDCKKTMGGFEDKTVSLVKN